MSHSLCMPSSKLKPSVECTMDFIPAVLISVSSIKVMHILRATQAGSFLGSKYCSQHRQTDVGSCSYLSNCRFCPPQLGRRRQQILAMKGQRAQEPTCFLPLTAQLWLACKHDPQPHQVPQEPCHFMKCMKIFCSHAGKLPAEGTWPILSW